MYTPLLCTPNASTASQSYYDLSFSFLFISKARINVIIDGHSGVQKDGTSLSSAEVGRIVKIFGEDYIQKSNPLIQKELHAFLKYLEDKRLAVETMNVSSLRITVRCTSLEILENLWRDYTSGALNEAAQRYLVTDEVLDLYNLRELKLSTNIDEEEYRRCKAQLIEIEGKQISVTHTYTRKRTRAHTHTHALTHAYTANTKTE